jgi:predicted MFS family arabinose efflux permease
LKLVTRRDSPWLALCLLTAVSTVGFADQIVMNVLAVPIQAEFHLSDTQVGLLTGLAFAVLNVTLGIAIARLADRGRRVSLVIIGTLLWSAATALCGFVANFGQLFLARVGVGVGQAVGLPAQQSMIADLFPPEKRATAISVLMLMSPVGAFLGAAGGGWIAQLFGWRDAFLMVTLPGLVLAIAIWALISEPPRGRYDQEASSAIPSVGAVLKRLLGIPSARHLAAGSTIASLVGFGLNGFLTFLLVRKFDFSLGKAAFFAALLGSLPGAIAVTAGGRLVDRYGPGRPSLSAAIPGFCLMLAAPVYMFAITRDDFVVLLVLVFAAALFQYTYLGVTFGVFHNLLHSRMRATGSALLNGVYILVGQGLGTLLVGALSDWFAPGYGRADGLAYAMAITAAIYVWAGAHYLIAGRHLGADLAAVRGDRL